MKTGEAVYLPAPKLMLDELQGIGNDMYFFWSGKGKLKSAKADWQRTLTRLFELAGVEGHAHMFRHTLAVELLENNVSVEHVAAILGNSPAIVHKHYAPWIASRQNALEAAVSKIWN
jgi:site-specific recombinase XerD